MSGARLGRPYEHSQRADPHLARYEARMIDGIFEVPLPENEPVLAFAPGSPERAKLDVALAQVASEVVEIPIPCTN